jgi:hypothetical protein
MFGAEPRASERMSKVQISMIVQELGDPQKPRTETLIAEVVSPGDRWCE